MWEFHDCNCNGLGDIWWTDKCMYFSSIDDYLLLNTAFLVYLNTYFMCDTWPYDS